MTGIENTTETIRDDALLLLAVAMTNRDGGAGFIEAQEAAGQRQLVNSDRLPTRTQDDEAEYLALGFTFGDPDPGDPLFRPATLPAGWRREGTDHAMWSKLVDEHGRERVSIFYKAAFYDRDAFMRLATPYSYLNNCVYHKATPVLDETWLTRDVATATLAEIRDSCLKQATKSDGFVAAASNPQYWTERADEHRAEAQAADAMRAEIETAK